MFGVLEAVNFYDGGRIREKLAEAHAVAVRGVRQRLESGRLKRDEFVVSYLGGPAKSGARYARLYADQNNIYADHVQELGNLQEPLSKETCQALIIVDDFLVVLCYSSGVCRSGSSARSIGRWQVWQCPDQQSKMGMNRRTAWGSVRPAAGLLGRCAPMSGTRARC